MIFKVGDRVRRTSGVMNHAGTVTMVNDKKTACLVLYDGVERAIHQPFDQLVLVEQEGKSEWEEINDVGEENAKN